MSYARCLLVASVMTMATGTLAHAEDGFCVITAIAFDQNLNPLAVQGESIGAPSGRNLAKACAKDKVTGIDAAQAACRDNPDAHFVALFRRIDGTDLVKSKDSKAKFKEDKTREKAIIKMKSCAFWAEQTM